jgi:hypothetical protein
MVSVMPQSANVPLGGMQSFHANVTGSSDTNVAWEVNGITPGTLSTGTVDVNGLYTAPQALPLPGGITVTAVSHADPTQKGNASVNVTSDVGVAVQPGSASVELGATQPFSAQITGSGNPLKTVTWNLTGPGCAGVACGQITAGGNYTAPQILPSPPSVTATATSDADSSKKNIANITITSHFALAVSGPASVNPASLSQFSAIVTPVPGSNPGTAMTWSVSGPGCAGANNPCGTISDFGMYTAPSVAPQPNSIIITAISVADPNKSASANTQIITQVGIQVTPSNASVLLEHQQQFTATVTGLTSTAVLWSVNNILGGDVATVGTISNSPPTSGLYIAPVNMVPGRQVTIAATSSIRPGLSASAMVTLTSNIVVQVSPTVATRLVGQRQTLAATVMNTSNTDVGWTVNGVPNGDTISGEICITGSNPCQAPAISVAAGSVDYLAPSTVPSPSQVTVRATSQADNTQVGVATITIVGQIAITLSPPSATLAPSGVQQFSATVVGVSDQNVSWDVNGSPNGSLALGVICLPGSNPCQAPSGPMAGPIEYRAPPTLPMPNPVTLRATSEINSSVTQTAAIKIGAGAGPFISSLLPASVVSNASQPFPMRVQGAQFVAGNGTGSTVLFGGAAKTTNCPSTTECEITIDSQDVALPGTVVITIENPGSPPVASNPVNFVIAAPDLTEGIISLDSSNPSASGEDITVVEPSTAGVTPPTMLALQSIGVFNAQTNACTVGPSIVTVTRPAVGNAMLQLCLLGVNLISVNAVTFSGPSPPDLVAGQLSNSGGSISLVFTVTIPASAQPGVRTVFASGTNADKAALTGSLEVK